MVKFAFRILIVLTLGITFQICSAADTPNTSIDNAMEYLAKECISPLKSRSASKVAMTYIFHNGSKETAVSKFTKRLLTTHLIRETGRDIALIDRQDFHLLHKEDSFAFIFSTGTGNMSQPEAVDAILVGELITNTACRTMVLCIKAIDTKTSIILSAPVANIVINKDLAAKIGISELDLSDLPSLPQPVGAPTKWASELSSGFDPQKVTCSLDDPENIRAEMILNYRIQRAYLTSSLVSAGWSLLEREMFFLVAKDQAAVGLETSGYPSGEVVLRIEFDESGSGNSTSCFAKAIQMKDGRLLGQSQVDLTNSVAGEGSSHGIGGDENLAEALRKMQTKIKPAKEDSLIFTSSILLNSVFKQSELLKSFAKSQHPKVFLLRDNNIGANIMTTPAENDWENGFDVRKHNTLTLKRLNTIEKSDLNAIKASMTCCLLWGYEYKFNDDQSTFLHLGPLLDVVRQISAQYSLSPNGSDSTQEWMDYFAPGDVFDGHINENLSGRLLQSLHPKFRLAFDRELLSSSHVPTPLTFPAGVYHNSSLQFKGRPLIHFDYKIETVWKDVFPSTMKVTIDLTPMKNNIYKIEK